MRGPAGSDAGIRTPIHRLTAGRPSELDDIGSGCAAYRVSESNRVSRIKSPVHDLDMFTRLAVLLRVKDSNLNLAVQSGASFRLNEPGSPLDVVPPEGLEPSSPRV